MLDLFGEVVITLDDVECWLDSVPNLSLKSQRRQWYIEQWDVTNKIKCSILDGSFTEFITSDKPPPEPRAADLAFQIRYR